MQATTRVTSTQNGARKYYFVQYCVLVFLLSSCTHYRIIPLVVNENEHDHTPRREYYAIAQNNILIPEWTIDEQGHYPTSKAIAWERFHERKDALADQIADKYAIPASFPYQCNRWLMMIGLVAVSPIVIPISYASGFPDPEHPGTFYRSLKKTISTYFSLSLNETPHFEPPLKDKYKIVTIHTNT